VVFWSPFQPQKRKAIARLVGPQLLKPCISGSMPSINAEGGSGGSGVGVRVAVGVMVGVAVFWAVGSKVGV